jgi:putative ABC transport system ATP-binding protein
MSAVVELSDVTKTYPPPASVTALADANLVLTTGESVAVTGPSGSGKSTMLSLLGTLERPTSGVVRFAGVDISTLSDPHLSGLRAWHIGFVFQQFFLLDHLSVLENVATGLIYRGLAARERRSAAQDALERVGLSQRTAHRPSQLSGGERQRAAIARAIVGRPMLVLADEPTGNLDSATGAAIITLLAGLADDLTAMVVITHDPVVASSMDRRVHLRDGRICSDSRLE